MKKNEVVMFKTTSENNHVIGTVVIHDYKNVIIPEWNRRWVVKALKDLRVSMSENGVLTGVTVVRVKGNHWLLVDGNHRVKVAKENGYDITANIVDISKTDLDENKLMELINTTSNLWKPIDYLNNGIIFHKNKDYMFLNEVMEDTGITVIALYKLFAFDQKDSVNKETFEQGSWKSTTKSLGMKTIKYATELNEHIDFSMSSDFLRGFIKCVNKNGYSQKHMIAQLKRFDNHIHVCKNPSQYVEMINKIYNHCCIDEEQVYLG